MRLNRIVLPAVLVVFAMVAQVSVLARLHLPGAVPDLLLLTVLGLAISYGHVAGCLIGFFAGLLADLAPPADHAVGRYALVLCVIGYVAGLFKPESGRLRTAAGPMLVVIGAAIGTTVLYAAVGSLVGDTAGAHVGLAKLVFTATVYDLLLAPFVVPLVMAMARRFDHDPLSEDAVGGYGGSRGRMRTGVAPQRGGLFGRAGKMVKVNSMARGVRR
ncbi:rod shape-determining protein MreD [Actinacidiphila paucisporea]|uniref:Rod shape-determining protein MreD n=1 Tax=Actinacidiphila paucisporea TaxID=310782 RepID=A0A1M6WZ86_9ACTN|nr:rod shape-determining protein MreD [Actinacidiphila paucisporea]SHK98984.1 rod shape-determining protein MreD [Actinacidiphila paucisporea]